MVLSHLKNKIKYSIIAVFSLFFFLGWISLAENDLLRQVMQQAYYHETIFQDGVSSQFVWRRVFMWSTDVGIKIAIKKLDKDKEGNIKCKDGPCPLLTETDSNWNEFEIDCNNEGNKEKCKKYRKYTFDFDVVTAKKPPLLAWLTRWLLVLVITLSVTMILYNWMLYIIQTWQWKESKSLIKNIAYIVIGIVISLLSLIIITLIQSTWKTLEKVPTDVDNQTDKQAMEVQKEIL